MTQEEFILIVAIAGALNLFVVTYALVLLAQLLKAVQQIGDLLRRKTAAQTGTSGGETA